MTGGDNDDEQEDGVMMLTKGNDGDIFAAIIVPIL